MQIGLIGLGKMGFNLALNMHSHKHEVFAYDLNEKALQSLRNENVRTFGSIDDLCRSFTSTKIFWLMIPAGNAVDATIEKLKPHLKSGDIIIDGGNSFFKDSV
jgi:6-phosphogluconate dehydrogenase